MVLLKPYSLDSNQIIYEKILDLLNDNSELKPMLEVTNQRIVDLTPNWYLEKGINFSKFSNGPIFWTKVEGSVKGIIGNFLFLEDRIIDLEKIQGWLFTGDGFN